VTFTNRVQKIVFNTEGKENINNENTNLMDLDTSSKVTKKSNISEVIITHNT